MGLRQLGGICLLLGTICVAADGQAAATRLVSQQLVVKGDINVDATALNDKGVVVGTMYANITDAPVGIMIAGTAVSVLPPPYDPKGGPYPQAIDQDGNVVGWAGRGPIELPNLFYWHAATKTYDMSYNIALNTTYAPGIETIVNAVGAGSKGKVFYNLIWNFDASDRPEFGVPGHFAEVPLLSRFVRINSINAGGQVAGLAFASFGPTSVFAEATGHYTLLKPAGAYSSAGGYINASQAVAGSYADQNRVQHGFIFKAGQYASFDMPETASAIAVTGFSDTGRVVGVYTSAATGGQRGFLYNGTTVSLIGRYGTDETVAIAVNNKSTMLVARQFNDRKPNYESFQITCSGAGC